MKPPGALSSLLEAFPSEVWSPADGGWQARWNHTLSLAHHVAETIASQDSFLSDPSNDDFQLFRKEDWLRWVIFSCIAALLLIFDNVILHRNIEALTFSRSCAYTVFWVCCAASFNVYVYVFQGSEAALTWSSGYLMEWMLSIDNLFVFHLIFKMYGTPEHLRHKPLFYGVVGALFFRLLFFVVEEALFHSVWWVHLVLGGFLIYTGMQSAFADEGDEDFTENPVARWLSEHLPFINGFDTRGRFFVKSNYEDTNVISSARDSQCLSGAPVASTVFVPGPAADGGNTDGTCESSPRSTSPTKFSPRSTSPRKFSPRSGEDSLIMTPGDFRAYQQRPNRRPSKEHADKTTWRATKLLLVVLAIEFTDIAFAVDSVSAIVAQIPDLYLAYTACVFAMLGLRAMFFVVDGLIRKFVLLKYGVGFILVFIGAKLIARKLVHLSPMAVAIVLLSTVLACIVGSFLWDKHLGGKSARGEDLHMDLSCLQSEA